MQATAICIRWCCSIPGIDRNSKKQCGLPRRLLRYCVEIGGALTGEHGVGMEKSELMTLMFSDADLR